MVFDIDNFVFIMNLTDAAANTDIKIGTTVTVISDNTNYYCDISGDLNIGGERFLTRLDTDIAYHVEEDASIAIGDGTTGGTPNKVIPVSIFLDLVKRVKDSEVKITDLETTITSLTTNLESLTTEVEALKELVSPPPVDPPAPTSI